MTVEQADNMIRENDETTTFVRCRLCGDLTADPRERLHVIVQYASAESRTLRAFDGGLSVAGLLCRACGGTIASDVRRTLNGLMLHRAINRE